MKGNGSQNMRLNRLGLYALLAAAYRSDNAEVTGHVALMTPQRKVHSGYFGLQEYSTADVYLCEGSK